MDEGDVATVPFPVSEAPRDAHGDGSVSSKLRPWWCLGGEKKEQREQSIWRFTEREEEWRLGLGFQRAGGEGALRERGSRWEVGQPWRDL